MQENINEITRLILITTLVILLMGAFIIVILLLYRKKQIENHKNLEQIKHEYEKSLLKTQLEIQEQTIQTISRDIHDNITLTLTLAKLKLTTIKSEGRIAHGQTESAIGFISKAISDLTNISRSLNSDIIIERGLISALQEEVNKLNGLNRFFINLDISGSTFYMDAQKELFIFRIIQEAFNNILKHAFAKSVSLRLNYAMNFVSINLKDDGIGFNYPIDNKVAARTAGLVNMKKRAELINGTFEISSRKDIGTEINLVIPLSNEH